MCSPSRDDFYRRLARLMGSLALLALAAVMTAGAAQAGAAPEKIKLVVWGLPSGEWTYGRDAAIEEFERRHPDIDVVALSMGAGGMNPQKLMTSIVGHVPPDIVHQDRFTIGDWASRDTFMPLDDLIARDSGPDAIRPEDYYSACWQEATYHGRVYAIPYTTDDRALYWNRAIFRQCGLDPDRPPRTWDELLDIAVKLTKYRSDGTFERIGFIPNFGNSWLYLYSWQNGGEFMSPDGRKCTLNNPYTAEALAFMVRCYDALKGAERIGAFQSTFQPNEMDPFLTGKVVMKIDGNWVLDQIARYAPQLDFGSAPAPVPAARLRGEGRFKGKPTFITWSGGFSFAIPRGARHVREAWEFIKWMNSVEGNIVMHRAQQEYNASQGRRYVPTMSANRKVNEVIFKMFAPEDPRFRKSLRMFLDLMPVSRFRPVTFVGQKLWDEHVRSFEQAIHHKATPEEALQKGQEAVQKEIDEFYRRQQYPLLQWRYVYLVLAVLVLALLASLVIYFRRHPLSRMARQEALAAYVFVSPWVLGFLVFTLGPIIASFMFSFCAYDVLHPARWVGLDNYRQLLGLSHLRVHFLEGISEAHQWWQYLQPRPLLHRHRPGL
ncbi:MAG: extracellular solute-binding protein [Armatimonadetes bacterium]|nr:extracellular solute-binding protein [Armatimonadota bacterium]